MTTKPSVVKNVLSRVVQHKPVVFNLNVNVTMRCNQRCPMCNAEVEKQPGDTLTLDMLKTYVKAFEGMHIPSVTLSGGEPTLAEELPEIIEYCAVNFPYSTSIVSNFYLQGPRFEKAMIAALENNIQIACSFDGFGDIAKRQRGVSDSENRLQESIAWVTEQKKRLGSSSRLVINTVLSDQNMHQVGDIADISEKYGWHYRISCANHFFYQDDDHPDLPTLYQYEGLAKVIDETLKRGILSQNPTFLKGIPLYSKKRAPKICPYTNPIFRTAKIFLCPNGDILLCDRDPIGNAAKSHFSDIIASDSYKAHVEKLKKCQGCWLPCFVESFLPMHPFKSRRIHKQFDAIIDALALPK